MLGNRLAALVPTTAANRSRSGRYGNLWNKEDIPVVYGRLLSRAFLFVAALVALGAAVAYLIAAYFQLELGIEALEKPFLASTLFLLLTYTGINATRSSKDKVALERIEQSLRKVEEGLSSLVGPDGLMARSYVGKHQVYAASVTAIRAARRRVWVTHLRNDGPMPGEASDKHFEECRRWAVKYGGRSENGFRRIILHGDSDHLREFCRRELEVAESDEAKNKYLVKLLKGPRHLTEAFNVGIFDDIVFLVHRDGDQLFGISLENEKFANNMMASYHKRLWDSPEAEFIGADLDDQPR